jgi:hypothetical protein
VKGGGSLVFWENSYEGLFGVVRKASGALYFSFVCIIVNKFF